MRHLVVVLLVVACSSSKPDDGPVPAEWNAAEYAKLTEQVTSSCRPRAGSARFESAVDAKNIPSGGVAAFLELERTLRGSLKAYLQCGRPAEALHVMALILEAYARIESELDAVLASISESDPTYQARMNGRAKMLDGLAMMVMSSVTMLAEPTTDPELVMPFARRLGRAIADVRSYDPERIDVALASLGNRIAEARGARRTMLEAVRDGARD